MFDVLNGSITLKAFALGVPMMAMVLGVAGIGADSGGMRDDAAANATATATTAQAPAARPGSTPNPEEAGVRKALEAYIEGHRTGQADAFRRAFQPEARMLSVREGKFTIMEISEYISRAPGKPAADEAERKRSIDFIDISDNGMAAVARLTLDYPTVKFTDYMTLLKVDGEWRIVNKGVTSVPRPAAAKKSS